LAGRDDIIRGYAEALFTIAETEGNPDAVENELFAFAKAVEQNGALREALVDPALPVENRKAVVDDLLGERAGRVTVALVGFIIEAGRAKDLGKIVEEMASISAEKRQHELAEVRTAVALTDGQRERIAEALARATGRTIEVKVVIDPSVVGGVIARVGDEVFDGSVASRLSEAKQQLAKPQLGS
jgi:F-type H+-transporting ATPase subunit delta